MIWLFSPQQQDFHTEVIERQSLAYFARRFDSDELRIGVGDLNHSVRSAALDQSNVAMTRREPHSAAIMQYQLQYASETEQILSNSPFALHFILKDSPISSPCSSPCFASQDVLG